MSKTAEKTITFGAAHTYIAHIREYPPVVRPTVHTNPSRKWDFSKTLFKAKEFENADFSFPFGCGKHFENEGFRKRFNQDYHFIFNWSR